MNMWAYVLSFWIEREKRMRKRRMFFFLGNIFVCIGMVGFGFLFMSHAISQYRDEDLALKDLRLEKVLDSVDVSLENIIEHYKNELDYETAQVGFLEAEKEWLETGQARPLLNCLNGMMMNQEEKFDTVAALVNGKVILSTNGKYDYWIPVNEDKELDSQLVICSDDSYYSYIGFVKPHGIITYVGVLDPVGLYEEIEKGSGLGAVGDMILTDDDHAMLLYRNEHQVVVHSITDEGDMENTLLQILLSAHRKDMEVIDFYEVKEGPYKDSYRARIAICPASLSRNKVFSIGVLHNEDKEISIMQEAVVRIFFFGGITVLGIALLIIYLIWIYRKEERSQREIEILKEKKEAMEALNEQTKELAHHQRLETIGILTSGVAHEFNNLMTPIMGYSIMTMETLPPENTEAYDYLTEIYEASRKAKELTTRLSELSRKNSSTTLGPVNPNEVIKQAVLMARTNLPKHVDFSMSLGCEKVFLYGNLNQLAQALLNLLINAIHAVAEKTGRICVVDYIYDGKIFITVEDNGTGMTKDVYEKIFEPFFTTKEPGKGTGLGLAIVRQTVEEHKGQIEVESEPGQGSKFTLIFPVYYS